MYVYKNVAPIYIWSIDFVAKGRRKQFFTYAVVKLVLRPCIVHEERQKSTQSNLGVRSGRVDQRSGGAGGAGATVEDGGDHSSAGALRAFHGGARRFSVRARRPLCRLA